MPGISFFGFRQSVAPKYVSCTSGFFMSTKCWADQALSQYIESILVIALGDGVKTISLPQFIEMRPSY